MNGWFQKIRQWFVSSIPQSIKQLLPLSSILFLLPLFLELTSSVLCVQACKGEDLGKVEFDEEIKKRFKMVYVPNWFSVDLKTGVSRKLELNKPFVVLKGFKLRSVSWTLVVSSKVVFCMLSFKRCSLSHWTRATASLPGCLQRMLGFQALMDQTQSVRYLTSSHF